MGKKERTVHLIEKLLFGALSHGKSCEENLLDFNQQYGNKLHLKRLKGPGEIYAFLFFIYL